MNTEVHEYNFLVSASTALQPIILSLVGDKKLATFFLETALMLEGRYNHGLLRAWNTEGDSLTVVLVTQTIMKCE